MPASSSRSYSSGSDEDPKAPIAKSRAKVIRDEGAKPSVPSNERRVTFAELMKRKAEDDDKDTRQRTKDRIRRKIQRAEEKRQFLDGVPSDSDADASEEETTSAEAEEDSDSDDDFYVHPDITNNHDSDSEEKDSEKDSDENSEKDSDDESDNSYGSDK
ncbi:transcription initiation factor TFIID subunit 11-like [Papaver somniferum]|uniref:transcription initiation factor TFIID subunit 11-like n=1 Tax=Papaver somniferum TaxID=3469 RepID=UPI000E6F8F3B|nr:transcription initiation factor TFIID subunit 11-like [Papaver somniferum]